MAKPKVVFEFPDKITRDVFLCFACNGEIGDLVRDSLAEKDINVKFDYSKTFTEWGWDGKGDPTIKVMVTK